MKDNWDEQLEMLDGSSEEDGCAYVYENINNNHSIISNTAIDGIMTWKLAPSCITFNEGGINYLTIRYNPWRIEVAEGVDYDTASKQFIDTCRKFLGQEALFDAKQEKED